MGILKLSFSLCERRNGKERKQIWKKEKKIKVNMSVITTIFLALKNYCGGHSQLCWTDELIH